MVVVVVVALQVAVVVAVCTPKTMTTGSPRSTMRSTISIGISTSIVALQICIPKRMMRWSPRCRALKAKRMGAVASTWPRQQGEGTASVE